MQIVVPYVTQVASCCDTQTFPDAAVRCGTGRRWPRPMHGDPSGAVGLQLSFKCDPTLSFREPHGDLVDGDLRYDRVARRRALEPILGSSGGHRLHNEPVSVESNQDRSIGRSRVSRTRLTISPSLVQRMPGCSLVIAARTSSNLTPPSLKYW